MNASPLAQISHSMASVVLGALGSGVAWCVYRFSRAPVTSTGVVLMVLAYGITTGNALLWQTARHPAPMFAAHAEAAMPAIDPVDVAAVPQPIAPAAELSAPEPDRTAAAAAEPPAPLAPAAEPASAAIGNAEVARMQEKLKAMGLFNGTVDGYYGPRTADAIRAFEERFGLPRTGAISPEVLDAIENAPLTTSEAPDVDTEGLAILIAEIPPEAMEVLEASAPAVSGEGADTALAQLEAIPEDGPVAEDRDLFSSLLALARPEPSSQPVQPALDTELVSAVQRGLSQLGFLRGPTNGIAGDETARAIRNFEIFHNFEPTGTVSYALLDRLVDAGADL